MTATFQPTEVTPQTFHDLVDRIFYQAARMGLPTNLRFITTTAPRRRRRRLTELDGQPVVYVPCAGRTLTEVTDDVTRAVVAADQRKLDMFQKAQYLRTLRRLADRRGTWC